MFFPPAGSGADKAFCRLRLFLADRPAVLVVAACMLWALAQWLVSANLDSYFDMLESYAWGQTLPWGTYKHPPLFAWVAHAWFCVMPRGALSFFVLSYLNVAVGLLGVMRLARRLDLGAYAAAAAMLLLLAFPYTTLAAKFNANSQLLSLWPWVAVCLLESWRHGGWRGAWWSVALGLVAAAAMLAKYYSGVFLLGLGLVALLCAQGRRWLLTPRPWVALAVFALALLPHVAWMKQHDFVTLHYAQEQGGGALQWRNLRNFALAPLYYWLIGWVVCLFCTRKLSTEQGWRGWGRRALRSWMPQGWDDVLFWLAFMPWAITLLFGLSGKVDLSTPWAIPIGYAFSLLWLRNLSGNDAAEQQAAASGAVARAWLVSLAVVAVLAPVGATLAALRGQQKYYRPDAEAGQAVVHWWRRHYPQVPLQWVGGNWAENAVVAFYGDASVRVLPGLPDAYPALFDPHPLWQAQGGVLLCPQGAADGDDGSAPKISLMADGCDAQAQRWLQQHGQSAQGTSIVVQRSGWRFPKAVAYRYMVYPFVPANAARVLN